ncbi:MAG: hypothetical protein U1E16_16190 [Hyphomicrobiales bacterium]|uniref:hypothetical protein n=1 Tax=Aestuariivirga sp. TaxID=2650926 RepID=UPI0035AF01EC
MLDLHSAFENFAPDLEVKEPQIDGDFITNFLMPYFRDLPREQLAAAVAEMISLDQRPRAPGQPR